MLRTFVSAAIAVALCANLALAADKADKKGTTVTGIVKKVDADKKVITVTVRKSKTESEDKEYKIEETTKFVVISGTDKQELTAKEGIKNEQLKEGAGIAITVDESGKVTQVQFGKGKKKGDK